MTSEQKIESIRSQMDAAVPVGGTIVIRCPYCDTLNFEGVQMCCDTLRKACLAILERAQVEKFIEMVQDKIAHA